MTEEGHSPPPKEDRDGNFRSQPPFPRLKEQSREEALCRAGTHTWEEGGPRAWDQTSPVGAPAGCQHCFSAVRVGWNGFCRSWKSCKLESAAAPAWPRLGPGKNSGGMVLTETGSLQEADGEQTGKSKPALRLQSVGAFLRPLSP